MKIHNFRIMKKVSSTVKIKECFNGTIYVSLMEKRTGAKQVLKSVLKAITGSVRREATTSTLERCGQLFSQTFDYTESI